MNELATAGVAAAIAALCFLGFGLQGCGLTVEVYSPKPKVSYLTDQDRQELDKLINEKGNS